MFRRAIPLPYIPLPRTTRPRTTRSNAPTLKRPVPISSLRLARYAEAVSQGIASGQKALIVLDQFERWLHARTGEEDGALIQALRQCDGGRVQCLVMVRDDFWMAATRFMRALEIRLVEGHNSAAVDLFPVPKC